MSDLTILGFIVGFIAYLGLPIFVLKRQSNKKKNNL